MPGRRFLTGLDGAADVAETTYTPFQAEADAAPVRLIVRRLKPAPGSQLALFANTAITASSPTGTGRRWNWRPIIAVTPRSRMGTRTWQVRRGAEPSPLGPLRRQRRLASVQVMAHNLARWTARIGLGQQIVTTKTLRRRVFALADGSPARPPIDPASSKAWLALGGAVQPRPGAADCEPVPLPA